MNEIVEQSSNIKRYLSGVFEEELNIYVQEQTLLRMKNTYNKLCIPAKIQKPYQEQTKTEIPYYMTLVGLICGFVYGIIKTIIEYIHSGGGFGNFILAIIMFIICALIGAVVGGLTLGTFVGFIASCVEKQKIEDNYQIQVKQYNDKVKKDNLRLKIEKKQKEALYNEINAMEMQIADNKNKLHKIYEYGVLYPDYQNIYAVSSIYGYFKKGRTASLEFNAKTGDQGAYNIYENELRSNIIIRNTQEIINRLDEIAKYQYELTDGLRKANEQINSLCSGINTHIKKTANALQNIERCQSVIEYNSTQTKNQLDFMSWLQLTYL